ncbi:Sulfotransferase family cytosolic 1B member 1 [Eumeta japonica]|uniref:Sulfotransferase family cytosolic 1B member 1 n=1 Tax=Eumeta variegata TaxID=151549 RepID=A0A4C1UNI1_EUMVA|nr:Sulfotransferase family cytosolic 1B member 1 [Eumeta japonica]
MSSTKSVRVENLEPEVEEFLLKQFPGQPDGYAYFGEHKYVHPKAYKDHVEGIYNMPLRKDDIWVATFPRSGTTWAQELTWLVSNNLDYEGAAKSLSKRFVFIEFPSYFPKELVNKPIFGHEDIGILMDFKALASEPSPRFIKTHLPMSLLSPQLLDTSRVVYVARDPRDVAISYYHLSKLRKIFEFSGDFKTYWRIFLNNLVISAPYFEHLKEAWKQRKHPNMLFLFYEEMYKDLPGVVRRVAKFFEKKYSDAQIRKLCEHLDIDNMRKNKSVNPDLNSTIDTEGAESFIRKGKAGGWREYFDEGMAAEAEKWMRDNLSGTDLRFPEVGSA